MLRFPALIPRRPTPVFLYGASFATTWSLLALEPEIRVPDVAAAFLLQIAVGVQVLRVRKWDRRPWVGIAGMLVFLVSVALLRAGVGQTAGYTSLLLFPVFWAAVRLRRVELACSLVGSAVLLFVPLVLTAGPHYPQSGWRTGALWLVIAAGLGSAVLTLVDQLHSSDQRHRLLADNSSDLVVRFAVDGAISYASPASQTLLGYAPGELIGHNIAEHLHPEEETARAARAARIDAAPEAISEEFRMRHRDGRWLWFEATIRTVRGPGGEVRERQGAIRLIEERKRLQMIVERQRDDATNLLAEQSALRKIATLVAAGAPANALFSAVAEQVARLFDGTLASVVRFELTTDIGDYLAGWSATPAKLAGQKIDLHGNTATARVYQTGHSAEVASYAHHANDPFLDDFSLGGGFAAPITTGGRLWGAIGVALGPGNAVPAGAQERLSNFAELVAVAISTADALEILSREATTDAITGLANYRAFHERLAVEVERASRHGRALSVAVLDLDHFKQVNDTHGHQIGDRVLTELATRLTDAVRSGELMARIGGEEFAWLMPEATPDGAYAAAERVRHAIQATPFVTAGTLTISIGVCSNDDAKTAEEFVDCADQALYWSKQAGRNTTCVYTAAAGRVLPKHRLEHTPADPQGPRAALDAAATAQLSHVPER